MHIIYLHDRQIKGILHHKPLQMVSMIFHNTKSISYYRSHKNNRLIFHFISVWMSVLLQQVCFIVTNNKMKLLRNMCHYFQNYMANSNLPFSQKFFLFYCKIYYICTEQTNQHVHLSTFKCTGYFYILISCVMKITSCIRCILETENKILAFYYER